MRGRVPIDGSVWPYVELVIAAGCSVLAVAALVACLLAPGLQAAPLVVAASVGLVLICLAGVSVSLRRVRRQRNG